MAENTKIEWCDHTVNPWWGCSKVNTGCKNCYAEKISKRFGGDVWGEHTNRKRIKSAFTDLDKYQLQAAKRQAKKKIFIGSMMDIFEDTKPLNEKSKDFFLKKTGHLRALLFFNIQMGYYPNLIFLFLTKRPENISLYIPHQWLTSPPDNVWFGTSISDKRSIHMSTILADICEGKNTFLSIEPQIEDVSELDLNGINWVIQGGESGHNKRPFDLEWAYSMRDKCSKAKVPYFFKQIDGKQAIPEDLFVRQFPKF